MTTSSPMPEIPVFVQQQLAFTARVRDPSRHPLPAGVDARRMAVYEELVFNTIDDALRNAFPVLHKISTDNDWLRLVRGFIAEHRARSPLFPELPGEFLHYLTDIRSPRQEDFPFLCELAHYEWLELALSICQSPALGTGVTIDGDLLTAVPVFSPLAWLHTYTFAVHRIGPEMIPERAEEEPVHLLIYRNREEHVGFMELNAVTAKLLQKVKSNSRKNAKALLQDIAAELQHPNPETVIRAGSQILSDLVAKGVILGTRTV